MSTAATSGEAPAGPDLDLGEPAAEPFLLECFLADIRALRSRSQSLMHESVAEAEHRESPAWSRLQDEVTSAHRHAERTLVAAAHRDGVPLAAIEPVSPRRRPARGSDADDDPICRFRQSARELEQQCASAIVQAHDLGLAHLGHALSRWRRELIGLEQPLIEVNAETSEVRRT